MRLLMTKANQALMPFDEPSREALTKLKTGAGVWVEVTQARNLKFHRKLFGLLNLAFDLWEPVSKEWRGEPVRKHFDRFREDITILAGHYEAIFDINGQTKLKAKSISFANCTEEEFAQVYKGILDVVWRRILRHANYKTPEDVDRVVNQLLGFE